MADEFEKALAAPASVGGTSRRAVLKGAAAAAALGALALPARAADDKSVLKIVMSSSLRVIDPIYQNTYPVRNHGYFVFDTLFGIDDKFDVHPQMVDTFTVSDDKLTYTFKLRDGLKFHDGAPVTSADVVASLQRWGKRDSMGMTLFSMTQDLVAVDDNVFRLVLKEPYGLVLDSLGKPGTYAPFIMPKRLAETPPDQSIKEVIGSGPFRFVAEEFQPGVKAVYRKFEGYVPRKEPAVWLSGGKVAGVDRIEWINMSDAQTAVNALIAGEVDFIEHAPFDLLEILSKEKDVVVADKMKVGMVGNMQLNWTQPPFNNPKVRQAVLAAVYQKDYLDAQVGDPKYYSFCGAMFVCDTPLATEVGATQTAKPDLARARALLKEAGYKGEKVVVMRPSDNAILSPAALVTAQTLRSIGMNVEIFTADIQTLYSRRASQAPVEEGGWSIYQGNWQSVDMLNPITNAGVNARGKKGGFFGWADDAGIEAMKKDFAREVDPAKRKEIAEKIQKRAYDLVTYIPTGKYNLPYAYRSNLVGLNEGPGPTFWNVRKT